MMPPVWMMIEYDRGNGEGAFMRLYRRTLLQAVGLGLLLAAVLIYAL